METLGDPHKQLQVQQSFKPRYRLKKRWKKVSDRTHPNKLRATNDTIMLQYYDALKFIKRECLGPDTTYYERDYRDDTSDPCAVHQFSCPQLSFNLECDFTYFMQIEYDFAGFPRIDELLWRVGYAKELGMLKYKARLPDLLSFFKSVVAYQRPQFIHTL
jgi:hypothetical protein